MGELGRVTCVHRREIVLRASSPEFERCVTSTPTEIRERQDMYTLKIVKGTNKHRRLCIGPEEEIRYLLGQAAPHVDPTLR